MNAKLLKKIAPHQVEEISSEEIKELYLATDFEIIHKVIISNFILILKGLF